MLRNLERTSTYFEIKCTAFLLYHYALTRQSQEPIKEAPTTHQNNKENSKPLKKMKTKPILCFLNQRRKNTQILCFLKVNYCFDIRLHSSARSAMTCAINQIRSTADAAVWARRFQRFQHWFVVLVYFRRLGLWPFLKLFKLLKKVFASFCFIATQAAWLLGSKWRHHGRNWEQR